MQGLSCLALDLRRLITRTAGGPGETHSRPLSCWIWAAGAKLGNRQHRKVKLMGGQEEAMLTCPLRPTRRFRWERQKLLKMATLATAIAHDLLKMATMDNQARSSLEAVAKHCAAMLHSRKWSPVTVLLQHG